MADIMKSFQEENDQEDYYALRLSRLSRLSIETSDGCEADVEMSDEEEEDKTTTNTRATTKYSSMFSDFFAHDGSTEFTTSVPGTPERLREKSGEWTKKCVSDTEARGPARRRKKGWGRRARERRLDEAWEMKKKNSNYSINDNEYCRVLIKPSGNDSKTTISMDIDEVKACRELGIDLPSDWMVEINSGGNSPVAISSPGSDPKEVKARLKVWAQAVALASASSLSG